MVVGVGNFVAAEQLAEEGADVVGGVAHIGPGVQDHIQAQGGDLSLRSKFSLDMGTHRPPYYRPGHSLRPTVHQLYRTAQ